MSSGRGEVRRGHQRRPTCVPIHSFEQGWAIAQEGCLLIADITGYTEFLGRSELDHAQDSFRSLLQLLLDQTKPPLLVSSLEGDAVFSYALAGGFAQGQTFVDAVESAYVAFRRALERMVLNTTCICNACRNLPNLDLKFFVLYGEFAVESLGSRSELIGADVNLVHRLTKNTIEQAVRTRAYCVYTEAAVEHLGLTDFAQGLDTHNESYEHIGEVRTYVQDMQPLWTRERAKAPIAVDPESAVFIVDHTFSLEPAQLWDHVTRPDFWAVMSNSERVVAPNRPSGRTESGVAYQCVHGKTVLTQTIVDWEPFTLLSFESTTPLPGTTALCTIRLVPLEPSGTRVEFSIGKAEGPLPFRMLCDLVMRLKGKRDTIRGFEELDRKLDTVRLNLLQPPQVALPPSELEAAVQESLPRQSESPGA